MTGNVTGSITKKRMQLPHLRTGKLRYIKFLFLGFDTLCDKNAVITIYVAVGEPEMG